MTEHVSYQSYRLGEWAPVAQWQNGVQIQPHNLDKCSIICRDK